MTTWDSDEAARRKGLRRRHLLQRQTIVFGSLIVILAALALAALGVFLNILPAPFDPDFTDTRTEEDLGPMIPCPADQALPVPWTEVTANVYNGAGRTGLAAATAQALRRAGLATAAEANYPGGTYEGSVLILTGEDGISSAYSILPLVPSAEILLDPAKTGTTIDVVVGPGFESLESEATQFDPGAPLTPLEGCRSAAELRGLGTPEEPPTGETSSALRPASGS